MTVRIAGLSRRYGSEAALAGIDLDVADGEFLALLGPSGAGKTTLLRLIAGLDQADNGSILIDDRDVRRRAPRDRRIGFVFQNYALFRHMNVARNIAFGLSVKPRRERPSRAAMAARVTELLDLMQLSGFGDRFPAQLSGGQRQRVALARALAVDPRVLLLDEPFGALDAKVRGELRDWLRALRRQLGLTTIFVTHDQHEAFQLADRIAILNAGRIEQVGTSADIRANPATPFVAEFLNAADHPLPGTRTAEVEDAVVPAVPHRRSGQKIADPTVVLEGHLRRGACAVAHYTERDTPLGHAVTERSDPISARGPSWTPRVAAVIPGSATATADLPVVAAGELWLVELPDPDAELTSLEHRALTSANVIVYDRALANAVAAVLPLGAYAEPAVGDGLARSLQFVRDGWSVVRLIERPSLDGGRSSLPALTRQLHEAGASAGWTLRRFTEDRGGRWLCRDDTRLGDADLLLRGDPDGTRDLIVVGASSNFAPDLRAVVSNGLAG